MSVLIKDMGKPKSCYAVIDGESEYCPFVNTDDDCVLLLKKGTCEGTWADQYSKCPLIEAPELCEDAVSRQAAIDALWKALYAYEDETERQFQESDELNVGDWIGHRIFVQNMNDIDRQTILNLPSAQPERLKGRWTDNNACPFCGFQPWYERDIHTLSYCPNCGADMRKDGD